MVLIGVSQSIHLDDELGKLANIAPKNPKLSQNLKYS